MVVGFLKAPEQNKNDNCNSQLTITIPLQLRITTITKNYAYKINNISLFVSLSRLNIFYMLKFEFTTMTPKGVHHKGNCLEQENIGFEHMSCISRSEMSLWCEKLHRSKSEPRPLRTQYFYTIANNIGTAFPRGSLAAEKIKSKV